MSRKQYWLKLDYLRLLSDEKLKVCSLEEQGLWLRLLCQAARSPRQGYLLLTGKVKPTNAQLARIIGVDEEKLANILASSLIPLGLISQTRGKVLYFKNWRKYQRGRTLDAVAVGPKSGSALDQKKPLEKEEEVEVREDKEETYNVEANGTPDEDKSYLYVANLVAQEEKAEKMWTMISDHIPALDLNALRRLKDALMHMTIGPMQILELRKLMRNTKNAKDPSSYMMAECRRLLEEHGGV